MNSLKFPLLVSLPHSGEKIPDFCTWLQGHSETVLFYDVDRYVDQLYEFTIDSLALEAVIAPYHRYALDLNRFREDVDQDSVQGSLNPSGKFTRGLHWVKTIAGDQLLPQPMSREMHLKLVDLIYVPFHNEMQQKVEVIRARGAQHVYHLDLHSMPSLGTAEHRDPGEKRADIVVSDQFGKSSRPEFTELVIKSYKAAGFTVAHNWPYYGGRITEFYGRPLMGHSTVQVELNRGLYMNETTKAKGSGFSQTAQKLDQAMKAIAHGL